jgi:class 3 adenylate cyclase
VFHWERQRVQQGVTVALHCTCGDIVSDLPNSDTSSGLPDGQRPPASTTMPIAGDHLKRKLAVIMASDVAGYSKLIAFDEEDTIRRYADISRLVHKLVAQQAGRVFNTAGDAILAEFDSAVNAVRCALDVQEAVTARSRSVTPDRRLKLRIGIAIGDVIVADNGDLLGDGVNIAARLESLAVPGGVCISQDVLNLVQSKIGLGFDDLGPQELKNIPQLVHAFRVTPTGEAPYRTMPSMRIHPGGKTAQPAKTRLLKFGLIGGLCAAGIAAVGVFRPEIGFRSPQVRPGTSLDPSRIPLIRDAARSQIARGYMAAGGHKAIALSFDGDSVAAVTNSPSEQAAAQDAQIQCDKDSAQTENKRPCFIYAIGERVQVEPASFPMPLPIETRSRAIGQPFGSEDQPLQRMNQGRRLLREYPAATGPKALAIGTRGDALWGAMATGATVDEAVRRALEFCGFRAGSGGGNSAGGNPSVAGGRTGPCILYAVGNDIVTVSPRSRKITGVLVISADPAIPDAERERLIQAYDRTGWQALARGRGGTWHAAGGTTTEQSAVDAALATCTQADKDCQLYAIGRFLVGPEAG